MVNCVLWIVTILYTYSQTVLLKTVIHKARDFQMIIPVKSGTEWDARG